MVVRKLLPESIPGLEIERMELPPRAAMGGVPHKLGTREYLTCERGSVELVVSGETYRLAEGDVVTFRGDQRHGYHNPSNQTAAAYSLCALGRDHGIDCAVLPQPGKHDWPFADRVFAAALPWLAGQLGTPGVPRIALPGTTPPSVHTGAVVPVERPATAMK